MQKGQKSSPYDYGDCGRLRPFSAASGRRRMSESPSDAISRPLATITRVEKNYLCAEAKDGGAEWFVRSSYFYGRWVFF